MSNLPKSLLEKAKQFDNLDTPDRKSILQRLYNEFTLSWIEIAKLCDTYPNKVRRAARSFGIKSRNKSEAQALALQEDRHAHPTKGKGHNEETKIKISEQVAQNWENLSEEERKAKTEEAKARWAEKSDEEIQAFRQAAGEGVRKAAKEGSALEKFLLHKLIQKGYKVDFHKEHWVSREKLQIDLFLPELNVAIEVDGPSHFADIWGKEALRKLQARDLEKNGLLLQRGCIIIRVRQTKALSNKFKRDILDSLLTTVEQIKRKKPPVGKRHIILGEDL